MNPRTVRWQAGVTFALLLAVALAVAPVAVLWLGGAGSAWALGLNASYAHSLGDRGRSPRRMHGDRWVARYVAFGLLLPAFLALGLLLAGHDPQLTVWDFTTSESGAIAIGLATLFVLILASSLVDWYYIRPRIDGVIRTPPCLSSGSDDWKGPTRWWFLHRGLATLAYFAFALMVALVLMLMLVREHPAAAGVIGGVGGLTGLMLIFAGSYRAQLPTVAQFVLSPAFCLGDDLSFEAHKWNGRGFVLHVAVPVTKLVPLGVDGMPSGPPFVERRNSDLNESDLVARATVACAGGCAKLNAQCVVGAAREDRRRHLLVL